MTCLFCISILFDDKFCIHGYVTPYIDLMNINKWMKEKKPLSTMFWSCHRCLMTSTLPAWGAAVPTTLHIAKVVLLHNPNQHFFTGHAVGKVDHCLPVILEPWIWSQWLTWWYWDRDFSWLLRPLMLTI